MNDAIFFSIIIPTVGRASLSRAVESVLIQQTRAEFQVLVVNDSGAALFAAAWQNDARVQVIATPRVERSRARNAGADAARGAYFLFLDDDDWLLPDALENFSRAAPHAQWLLGDCHLVTPQGEIVTTLQFEDEGNCAIHALAGEWLPLQAACVQRELFFQVYGFRDLTLGEDRELFSRLALRADLKRVRAPVACVTRDARTSSSTYDGAHVEQYWRARDELLDDAQTFARVRASARDPYWRGRIARMYLNAAVLNLKRSHFAAAAARQFNALRALAIYDALRHKLFWRGVLQTHTSHTQ